MLAPSAAALPAGLLRWRALQAWPCSTCGAKASGPTTPTPSLPPAQQHAHLLNAPQAEPALHRLHEALEARVGRRAVPEAGPPAGGGGGGKARTASEPGTASGKGKGKGKKKGRATAPPVNAPSSIFVNPAYDGEDGGEHVEYSIVDASALRKTSSNQPVDADYGEVQYTAIDTNHNNRNSTSGGTLVDGNNHYDMPAPGRESANTLRQADIVYAMPGLEEALAGDVVYSSDAAAAAAAVVTYATAANDANVASALYSEPAKVMLTQACALYLTYFFFSFLFLFFFGGGDACACLRGFFSTITCVSLHVYAVKHLILSVPFRAPPLLFGAPFPYRSERFGSRPTTTVRLRHLLRLFLLAVPAVAFPLLQCTATLIQATAMATIVTWRCESA